MIESKSDITVCFSGSSIDTQEGLDNFLQTFFLSLKDLDVLVVTGGYQGIMAQVSEKAQEFLFKTLGILFSGYENDPEKSEYNEPNEFNNISLISHSIGERVHTMFEMSDYFIVLPGRKGTLHELLQFIEQISYGLNYDNKTNFKRIFVHQYWKDILINIINEEILNLIVFFDYKSKIKITKDILRFENEVSSKHIIKDIDSLVTRINNLISPYESHFITNIDIGIFEIGKKFLFLETYCTENYTNILVSFLKEYDSLLNNSGDFIFNHKRLNIKEIKPLIKSDFRKRIITVDDYTNKKTSTFEDWVNYNSKNNIRGEFLMLKRKVLEKYNLALFINININLPNNLVEKIQYFCSEFILNSFNKVIDDIYTYKIALENIRSAIAVIMARNLSHTDGSHVMVDFENSVEKELFEIDESYKDKNLTKENIKDLNNKIKAKTVHFNNQFKLYNQHLRNTMELVADVSGKIGIQSNYEYCLKEFLKDIQDNYFSKKNNASLFKYGVKGNFLGTGLNDGKAHSLLNSSLTDRTTVLFPGGENGKTAFISILKNIFRNLKKHSSSNNFTLNKGIDNEEKVDYYELDVSIKNAENDLKDDYYKVTITESSFGYEEETIKEKVNEINKHLIEDPIIQDDGTVKNSGWGLLEMRICAAYLIGLPLNEYKYVKGENIYKNNFRAFPMRFIIAGYEMQDSKCYLTHSLYLRKPKFATIWIENDNEINKDKRKEFEKAGFIIKLKEENRKGEIKNRDYSNPSQFIIGYHKYGHTAKHYNFRVISCNNCWDYNNNVEQLKDAIKTKWIAENKFSINQIKYKNDNTETDWLATSKSEKKDALIDNHCKHYKSFNGDIDEKVESIKNNFSYYEKATINNAYNEGLKNADDFLKLETINTNICIWDERIKEFLETNNDSDFGKPKISKRKVFELKGITIPTDNLHKYFYADDKKKDNIGGEYKATTLEDIIYHLSKDLENNHYIILHFSGFENIVGRSIKKNGDKYTIVEAYDELLKHLKLGKYGDRENPPSKYLIFTSGKGIPTTLPDRCYFIPYTTLKALIEKKPKIDLVSTLNSLRIINKK